MTKAKLCIFIEPDGFDADDLTPLVRIYGEPNHRPRMAEAADHLEKAKELVLADRTP